MLPPSTCGLILTRSKWFCDRCDAALNATWSRSDPPVSKESIEAIRSSKIGRFTERRFRRTSPGVLKAVSSADIFGQWRKEKGRISCAVVGNSDNMIGSNYGPIIDSHDVVIRMNSAITKKYEADVGKKTTFQSLHGRIAEFYKKPNKVLVIPSALKSIEFAGRASSELSINQSDIFIIHPDVYQCTKRWMAGNTAVPSSGVTLLVFAVHVCNKVNVFGYGLNKEGKYKHYFSNREETRPGGAHNLTSEIELRRKLEEEGIITVYSGTS
ncbi:CMP-N-acetylneuraminate-beta-galactosamide-alpha-2,3-sialyltransferase 1-like [Oscarella lobularis]|uniref:CMP-N-acetylneuraminate-beta-galactosamide- alpha-2,3-sialyltransferase 1-like n=1 Tax=Oscarella lobularis TaxID=121494 RepID=UPI0033133EBA